jgi:uncharacterized protein (TIGR02996 family)
MDEEVFHAALRKDPGDELTWSALADWLEEDGQTERAELLRLLRRRRTPPALAPCPESARVRELLAAGVKPVTVDLTNSIGMRFVLVLPGTFLMGSPPGEEGRGDYEQQHEVRITRPFWLGTYPVTQGQWKAVMGSNPSYFSREGDGKERVENVSNAELDLFPVESVSWKDAQDFLKKLAALDEAAKNGLQYRLPSEAEWEYACRGGHLIQDSEDGHTLPFHFEQPISSLSSAQANFDGNHPYGGAEVGPYLHRTCKVGSYEPNRLGLYDMHGNVLGWCLDWYGDYLAAPAHDPSGPSGGSHRVRRGGIWYAEAWFCRSASRFCYEPGDRLNGLGFRVALVPAPE